MSKEEAENKCSEKDKCVSISSVGCKLNENNWVLCRDEGINNNVMYGGEDISSCLYVKP